MNSLLQSKPSSTPAGKKIPRLGFLGVGGIGRKRLESIVQSELAKVVAIADSSREMAEQSAKIAGKPRILSSLEELLEYDLDGVVIATPSALHAEQAIAVLSQGISVFCQKPLGRSAEENRRVIKAARKTNRLLGVDLSYRHLKGVQKMRELIRRGELGNIYAVEMSFHNAYGPEKPWFYDARLSGGGCVIDLGIHLVDLALWMLDFPRVTSVSSRLFSEGEPWEANPPMTSQESSGSRRFKVEDYAMAQIDLATGAAIQLSCSWKISAGCDAMIVASFYGSKGGARLYNLNGSFFDFAAEHCVGTHCELLASPPDAWGGRAAVHWLQRLVADKSYDPEIEHLIEVSETLDKIYAREN